MFRVLVAVWSAVVVLGAQEYATYGDEQLNVHLQEAVERNPSVRRQFATYRAALQKIPQLTALPDPRLVLTQFLRTPETRVGPQTTIVSLEQRFPWFGKLSEKGKVAAKAAAYQAEVYEAAKADVIRQVKLAYYELAFVDRAAAITRDDLELLAHFEQLARARYGQGVGLQQQVVKLQAEITRQQNRIEQLASQRVDAEAALNSLMDHPPERPVARVPAMQPPKVILNLDAFYAAARRRTPEMRAAFVDIEKHEKLIHAARREYWPDFSVGVGFINMLGRRDPAGRLAPPPSNGKNAWSLTFGVELPVQRRKRDAGVLEATEALLASKEGYRAQQNRLEASIRSAAFEIETLSRQIALFDGTLTPQAEQALRTTEAAYATGAVGVLELLDSERVLLEVRLGLARMASEYMRALAELERAVGGPVPEA
ncbi:MAG: TolC family protein [bacterium]|nr:TolC family protein [bacterium]